MIMQINGPYSTFNFFIIYLRPSLLPKTTFVHTREYNFT